MPPIAGTIFRQTMNQPGVYWLLDAPFVQIVALYSNVAEPRFQSRARFPATQKQWLIKTLKNIKHQRDQGERKALVFATRDGTLAATFVAVEGTARQDFDVVQIDLASGRVG